MRATEGGVVLTAEVAQSHRASANDEGAGPSATGPRPCAAQQEDSAEVRASTHRVLLQGDSSSHQTKRTIACQASPLAAKVGSSCGCGTGTGLSTTHLRGGAGVAMSEASCDRGVAKECGQVV